jgi:hypothetical protein
VPLLLVVVVLLAWLLLLLLLLRSLFQCVWIATQACG